MSEEVAWGLTPLWLVLGAITTCIILLRCTKLHGCLSTASTALMQSCSCTCSCSRIFRSDPDDDPTYRPAVEFVAEIHPVTNQNYDYSEIDMGKTHTFQPSVQQNTPDLRYEECVIKERGSHTYSNCSSGSQEDTGTADRTSAPHNYAILEPGSNKRLMVKIVTEDLEDDDPNCIYFKLEPGTNKVIPQIHSNLEDIKKKSSEHTYFILEPLTETEDDENAYAVSDLMENKFFYLVTDCDTM